jgi:putative thioredoxin
MEFDVDVIENSYKKPIVVDFWAPWCGPCKILGPVLEKLADTNGDKWDLVKVNTEEFPAISEEYQIRSIPNVKMFINGSVVDEFVGSLTRIQIEKWLNKNIPDPLQAILTEILTLEGLERLSKLENFVLENPESIEGREELSKLKGLKNPIEAISLLGNIKFGHPGFDTFTHLNHLTNFVSLNKDSEKDIDQLMISAKTNFQNGDIGAALDKLINSLLLDNSYPDGLARKSILAIFYLLGSDHVLTKKYRKLFEMYLY